MRKTLAVASAVLMTVVLTACSDGGEENSGAQSPSAKPTANSNSSPAQPSEPTASEYCNTLKESQAKFRDLNIATLSEQEFSAFAARLDTLEEQAPAEVADDWATIGHQLDKFKSLLDEAGLGLDDIKKLQKGKLPKGVDPAKIQALAPKMEKFTADQSLENATQAIKENAETECNIALGE